jgi:DNA-binding winged helix-turn-helix (wHTH) protein
VFRMEKVDRSAQIVRFGIFEADLQSGELHKNGVRVPLQGQPFQVCALLLEHSGELVTREELRQKVWPEDTFVDFEQALNTAIAKIRVALGDEADNPRFVETLPRCGYRFIGPVDKPSSQASLAPKGRFERFTAKALWISLGATLLALLSGVGIWRFSRNHTEAPLPPIEVVPLAGLAGFESEPAFSPDGNHVAFALHTSNNSGIHTAVVGGEKSLRLTSDFRDCCGPRTADKSLFPAPLRKGLIFM